MLRDNTNSFILKCLDITLKFFYLSFNLTLHFSFFKKNHYAALINYSYSLGSTKIKMEFIFFNSLFKYSMLINLYGFLDKFQVVKRLDCLLLLLIFLLLLLLLFCKAAAFCYRNRLNLTEKVFKQVYYCASLAT